MRRLSFLAQDDLPQQPDEGISQRALDAAARVMSRLPLVPTDEGTLSFYAVLMALVENASRVPPLGMKTDVVLTVGTVGRRGLTSRLTAATLQESAAAALLQRRWRQARQEQLEFEAEEVAAAALAGESPVPRANPVRLEAVVESDSDGQ
jgi:hypothetical protein